MFGLFLKLLLSNVTRAITNKLVSKAGKVIEQKIEEKIKHEEEKSATDNINN